MSAPHAINSHGIRLALDVCSRTPERRRKTMNWNLDDAIVEVSGWFQILTIIWST
jgi:hypothetical protein